MSRTMHSVLRASLAAMVFALLTAGLSGCGGGEDGPIALPGDAELTLPHHWVRAQGFRIEILPNSIHLVTRVVIRNIDTGEEIPADVWLTDPEKTSQYVPVPELGRYYVDYYRQRKNAIGAPEYGPFPARNPDTFGYMHWIEEDQVTAATVK